MPATDRDRVLRPYEVGERAVRAVDRAAQVLWELSYLEEGDFFSVDIHGVTVAVGRLSEACEVYLTKSKQVHQ